MSTTSKTPEEHAMQEWQRQDPLPEFTRRDRDLDHVNTRLLAQVGEHLPEETRNAIKVVEAADTRAAEAIDAYHAHSSRPLGAVRNDSEDRTAERLLTGEAETSTLLEEYTLERRRLHAEAERLLRESYAVARRFQSMLADDAVMQQVRADLDKDRAQALKALETAEKRLRDLPIYDTQDRSQAIQRATRPREAPLGVAGGVMRRQVAEHLAAIHDLLNQARI